jgi:hypothetical protein
MNRDCQRIMESPQYAELFPDVRLHAKGAKTEGNWLRNADVFEIVKHGGSYRSAGVGGGITGMGFDLGIIDDPIKNMEEAYSQTIRDKIDEWYTSTFWTRQAPGARIILMLTRWHEDDLAGRLLKRMKDGGEQWEVVVLPAFSEPGLALHPDDDRRPNEALWPERFPASFLLSARKSLGSSQFAALYQQSPTIDGGNHFKSKWFESTRYLDGGDYWLLNGRKFMKAECQVFITSDPNASEKKSADDCGNAVWAVTPHQDLLALWVGAEPLGIDRIIPEWLRLANTYNPSFIGAEADGFQVSLVKEARRTKGMPPVRELSHSGKGKLVRATEAIIMAEAGKIWLPRDNEPWVQPFIDELCRFTGKDDPKDAMVDCTAYAAWCVHRLDMDEIVEPKPAPPNYSNAAASGLWGRKL